MVRGLPGLHPALTPPNYPIPPYPRLVAPFYSTPASFFPSRPTPARCPIPLYPRLFVPSCPTPASLPHPALTPPSCPISPYPPPPLLSSHPAPNDDAKRQNRESAEQQRAGKGNSVTFGEREKEFSYIRDEQKGNFRFDPVKLE